jgi:hypothetical protein
VTFEGVFVSNRDRDKGRIDLTKTISKYKLDGLVKNGGEERCIQGFDGENCEKETTLKI